MTTAEFGGNCPRNVAKDAKYAVRWADGSWKATLIYRDASGEQWLATTNEHPWLVKMVNDLKREVSDQEGGPFYINEFRQVLVPVGPSATYYLAGEYNERLEFEFEGHTLSGDALSLDGKRLAPGDLWEGPHPGIPYVLTAKNDICYETSPRPNVTRRVPLSEHAGAIRSKEVARQVWEHKRSSGRFYVNEFAQMFAPLGGSVPIEYVYIGGLDLEAGWFSKWAPAQ